MEALKSQETKITSFHDFSKGIRFKKEALIDELLSLGHAKITPQIAVLIGQEVETEIQKRKNIPLTSEFVSELVAEKLTELGLIKSQKMEKSNNPLEQASKPTEPPAKDSLSEDILKVLAPRETKEPVQIQPKLFSKEPLLYSPKNRETLEKTFCKKNEKGDLLESPEQFFGRIARAVAEADAKFDPMANLEQIETDFFNIMAPAEFLPDASILANAGKSFVQLFPCYALLVRDTTESVFETMKQAALLHKRGAGAVISFSQLRPSCDVVASTQTHPSGPAAFMKIFDDAMKAFAGDERSSAPDGAFLNIDHPDIFDFVSQADPTTARFKRFVGIGESFMKAIRQDADFALINPRSGKPIRHVRARKLFKHLVSHICKTGEPGLAFLDRLEAANPTPKMGFLVATSADGSQAFLPHETSANGFINLSACVRDKSIEWDKLKRLVHTGIHFLENTLEISGYPFPENAEIVKRNRKIGLGVMGWASCLEKTSLPYASEEALELASQVMAFIAHEADNASVALAHKRGSFPNYNDSPLSLRAQKRRHAVVTALGNSEFLSALAGCSVGILPLTDSRQVIDSEWKLRLQACFQQNTENGVYLPVELGKNVTEEEVARAFILAHQLSLKSLVFRRVAENAGLRLIQGNAEQTVTSPKIDLKEENRSNKIDSDGNYFVP